MARLSNFLNNSEALKYHSILVEQVPAIDYVTWAIWRKSARLGYVTHQLRKLAIKLANSKQSSTPCSEDLEMGIINFDYDLTDRVKSRLSYGHVRIDLLLSSFKTAFVPYRSSAPLGSINISRIALLTSLKEHIRYYSMRQFFMNDKKKRAELARVRAQLSKGHLTDLALANIAFINEEQDDIAAAVDRLEWLIRNDEDQYLLMSNVLDNLR